MEALCPYEAACTALRTALRNPSCCTTSNPAPPLAVGATIDGQHFARPKLGGLQQARLHVAQSAGQVAAESPPRIAIHRNQVAGFVMAKSIDVKFRNVVQGVIDKELADIVFPKSKREAAGSPVLIGEIQAIVVVADALGA